VLQRIVYNVAVHVILFLWLDVVVLESLRYRVLMTDGQLQYDHRLSWPLHIPSVLSPVAYVPIG
jgi:hypothetical protein